MQLLTVWVAIAAAGENITQQEREQTLRYLSESPPADRSCSLPRSAWPPSWRCHQKFGGRIYKRYGFVDAFHPTNDWTNPDVIGIDVGITLISAENLRTGKVWSRFMRNRQIQHAMSRIFA
jgi:hypothetical protein